MARPRDALLSEKALIIFVPEKNPPVYIMPIMQHDIRHIIGRIISITFPFAFSAGFISSWEAFQLVKRSPLAAFCSWISIGP